FKPSNQAGDPGKLAELAMSMDMAETPVPPLIRKGEPLASAYTYFAQFIGHDLTEDRTTSGDAGLIEPNETDNYRTPYLDLDTLYGDGPLSESHQHLYEKDGASFRLGEAKAAGETFDLPLDDKRQPQL